MFEEENPVGFGNWPYFIKVSVDCDKKENTSFCNKFNIFFRSSFLYILQSGMRSLQRMLHELNNVLRLKGLVSISWKTLIKLVLLLRYGRRPVRFIGLNKSKLL